MCRRLGLSIEPQKWGDLWHFDIPSLSFISNENSRDRHRPSRGARASRSAQVANWVNPRLILAARQRFGQTILSILLSCQKKSTDRMRISETKCPMSCKFSGWRSPTRLPRTNFSGCSIRLSTNVFLSTETNDTACQRGPLQTQRTDAQRVFPGKCGYLP